MSSLCLKDILSSFLKAEYLLKLFGIDLPLLAHLFIYSVIYISIDSWM